MTFLSSQCLTYSSSLSDGVLIYSSVLSGLTEALFGVVKILLCTLRWYDFLEARLSFQPVVCMSAGLWSIVFLYYSSIIAFSEGICQVMGLLCVVLNGTLRFFCRISHKIESFSIKLQHSAWLSFLHNLVFSFKIGLGFTQEDLGRLDWTGIVMCRVTYFEVYYWLFWELGVVISYLIKDISIELEKFCLKNKLPFFILNPKVYKCSIIIFSSLILMFSR